MIVLNTLKLRSPAILKNYLKTAINIHSFGDRENSFFNCQDKLGCHLENPGDREAKNELRLVR